MGRALVDEGDGMSVVRATGVGFQTYRAFMTLALNSPTEPGGVHYSRTSGEVNILYIYTSSTFGNREKQFPRVCERIKFFFFKLIAVVHR